MARLIESRTGTGEKPRYRVWYAYNVPNNMDYYAVDSPAEARSLIDELTRQDLEDPQIETNAFGLEELEADGYHEWYNDEGENITEAEV